MRDQGALNPNISEAAAKSPLSYVVDEYCEQESEEDGMGLAEADNLTDDVLPILCAQDVEHVYPTQALVLLHDYSREELDTTFEAIAEVEQPALVQLAVEMKAGKIERVNVDGHVV
jgi:hypothetical protein